MRRTKQRAGFLLSLLSALAILTPSPSPAQEAVSRAIYSSFWKRVAINVEADYVRLVGGSIRAEESPQRSPAYRLGDLGVNDGYAFSADLAVAITEKDRVSGALLFSALEGETIRLRSTLYDDVIVPPGRVRTTVTFAMLEFLYHRELLASPVSRWRLEVYGGARNFVAAPEARSLETGISDSEDCVALLVPTLGAKLSYHVSPRWKFLLDLSGSGPGDVFGVWAEPADVNYLTANLRAQYQITPGTRAFVGVGFSNLEMDFDGTETDADHGHNAVTLRSIQPMFGLAIGF